MNILIGSAAHVHTAGYVNILRRMKNIQIGLIDHDTHRGEEAARNWQIRYMPSWDEAYDQADGLIVCSETAYHLNYITPAARRRLPTLCEKPLAVDNRQGEELLQMTQSTTTPLYMALPVRFLPVFQQLKRVVEAGDLGRIYALNATNHGYCPGGWFTDRGEAGGGAVMDHTIHLLDIMRWITGKNVRQVYAETSHGLYNTRVEDTALLTLTFDDDVMAVLDPSWSRPRGFHTWGDITLSVIGSAGTVDIDALAPSIQRYSSEAITHQSFYYGPDMNRNMLEEFLEVIQHAPPRWLASGQEGFQALTATLAAYQSAATHQPVVLDPPRGSQ